MLHATTIRMLRGEFLKGFRDGWALYWSPFTGFAVQFARIWRRRFARP